MPSGGSGEQREERVIYVPGMIDREQQTRAEGALGQMSYWLLASRAYRYGGLRTHLVEILVRELAECLAHPSSQSATMNAQALLWAAWSYTFKGPAARQGTCALGEGGRMDHRPRDRERGGSRDEGQ